MRKLIFATVTAAAMLMVSCTKESIKTTYARQESDIEKYVNSRLSSNPEMTVTNNGGSVRLTLTQGSGEELSDKGSVSFYYALYVMSGSSISNSGLVATNKEDIALGAYWNLSGEGSWDIKTINLGETQLVEGLKNGLIGVKGGEECMILFSGEHGFGNKMLGTIPANSALAYHVWVESISND